MADDIDKLKMKKIIMMNFRQVISKHFKDSKLMMPFIILVCCCNVIFSNHNVVNKI